MNVRGARPEEHTAIAALMVDAYREYAPGLSTPSWEHYAHDIADIASRLHNSTLLVADDGEPVGAVTYYSPGTGGGYADSWPREWAGFRLLAVSPAARGRGIGRLLTAACIERARHDGAAALALGTTELMKTARAMYERMGFERAASYDFYPVPDVLVYAYLMVLGGRHEAE